MKFRIIQGCPCPESIAPYIALLARDTGATINSIYRGGDARQLLHAHGKHTQAEIHQSNPGISNPPGRSTHELRSDGVAYSGPVGRLLPEWCVGIDVNDGDVSRMMAHAMRHGWELKQPYTRGVEFHHICFKRQPFPKNTTMRLRLAWMKARLRSR
ncbi:MAG: hypothetical protein NVSMB60_26140 [Mycobacterium sp.]